MSSTTRSCPAPGPPASRSLRRNAVVAVRQPAALGSGEEQLRRRTDVEEAGALVAAAVDDARRDAVAVVGPEDAAVVAAVRGLAAGLVVGRAVVGAPRARAVGVAERRPLPRGELASRHAGPVDAGRGGAAAIREGDGARRLLIAADRAAGAEVRAEE